MQKPSKIIYTAILLIGFVLVLSVLIVFGFSLLEKTGPTPTAVSQTVYPAPDHALANKPTLSQGVYPPPSTNEQATTPTVLGALTIDDVQRIKPADAKDALDSKKAIFLDVRTSESFKSAHIPGAISIPEADIEARMNELDAEQWIIAYCS